MWKSQAASVVWILFQWGGIERCFGFCVCVWGGVVEKGRNDLNIKITQFQYCHHHDG